MNKRAARKAALDIGIGLTFRETHLPTTITGTSIKDYGGDPNNDKDRQRVKEAMDEIRDQMIVKLQGFSDGK